jgi:hypothetical protein
MLVARFSSPCVAHVNIAGRGSTIRKVFLLTIARAFGLRYVLHLHDYNYADYFRSRGACHLLFLGDLSVRKGVPEFLRALANPSVSSRCWYATLAGGGPIDDFRALAEKLGILEKLRFPG